MDERLGIWEVLFSKALSLIDSVEPHAGKRLDDWTFGGGTVLMRRYHHRFSKDIDIFVSDPQWLGYLSPKLSDKAASLTSDYLESAMFLKLRFEEGEIDFVASDSLTVKPWTIERILGRDVRVESDTEIIAKKVWHRGDHFTARDIFDLAMICEREPIALDAIQPILAAKREAILARIDAGDAALRESFEVLGVLDFRRSYDECVDLVQQALGAAGRPANLAEAVRRRFEPLGGIELQLPEREPVRKPPKPGR